jgi:tetrahydromethanopterin S-methyltransferase subunit C
MNGEILNESDGRYFYLNQVKLLEIWGAFFIIIIWSAILGMIVAVLGQKKVKPYEMVSINRNEHVNILAAIVISYLLSFLVGNFISGLTEFARQFLFLEISGYIFALILTTRALEKLRGYQ